MIYLLTAHQFGYLVGVFYMAYIEKRQVRWSKLQECMGTLTFPIWPILLSDWFGVDQSKLFQENSIMMTIVKLPLWLIMVDQLFYWLHRMFHSYRFLYRMHKIHHEQIETIPEAALHCHIVEHVVCNMLPVLLPIYILGFSYSVAMSLIFMASVNTVLSHGSGTYHSKHHMAQSYNFGLHLLADRMYGTYIE